MCGSIEKTADSLDSSILSVAVAIIVITLPWFSSTA